MRKTTLWMTMRTLHMQAAQLLILPKSPMNLIWMFKKHIVHIVLIYCMFIYKLSSFLDALLNRSRIRSIKPINEPATLDSLSTSGTSGWGWVGTNRLDTSILLAISSSCLTVSLARSWGNCSSSSSRMWCWWKQKRLKWRFKHSSCIFTYSVLLISEFYGLSPLRVRWFQLFKFSHSK